jgi:hypothetical protein
MKKALAKPSRPLAASTAGRVLQVTLYPADNAALMAIIADMTRPGAKPPAKADAVRDAIHQRAARIGGAK